LIIIADGRLGPLVASKLSWNWPAGRPTTNAIVGIYIKTFATLRPFFQPNFGLVLSLILLLSLASGPKVFLRLFMKTNNCCFLNYALSFSHQSLGWVVMVPKIYLLPSFDAVVIEQSK